MDKEIEDYEEKIIDNNTNKKIDEKMSLFEIAKELALLIDEIDISQEESDEKLEEIKRAMTNM